MTSNRTTIPAEGERRAASGYRAQYLVGASLILQKLQNGDLEWIRVADPEGGRVDDLQIATTARVDAYQMKWHQYDETFTLNDLTKDTDNDPSLITQLADGWQELRRKFPHYRIVVHLVTNAVPSSSTSAKMPDTDTTPSPYHFSAFIAQAWQSISHQGEPDSDNEWDAVWEEIRVATRLPRNEFSRFVPDCALDFRTSAPEETPDILALYNLLFATAAGAERVIELSHDELLKRLGWTNRYKYRNVHEFPSPAFLYRPIQATVVEVKTRVDRLAGGYIGVFGSPGAGKSTLLTQTLRSMPVRLVRYYAYVPESQDPSILRGESINFLHDITLRLQEAGFGHDRRPDPSDRVTLLKLFHEQLQELGIDYMNTGTKSTILIDGLDHIAREQDPVRPLLSDLPLPRTIPVGVYIVVGSQTDELADIPPLVHSALRQPERRIEIERLTPTDVQAIAQENIHNLTSNECQKVFELSGGHPLALIYLLKQLQPFSSEKERCQLLEDTAPYQNDIDEQYWGHWRNIENDDELVHILGLLARVRGSIPISWMSSWLTDRSLLRRLQMMRHYFEQEGDDCWVFFHNSFRLFLAARTAEPLLGLSSEQRDREYHIELATRYRIAQDPWQWETLYHLYSAEEHNKVIEIATSDWFRTQIEALRPLDAVQTDVRLAIRSAGIYQDVVALARLTLIGASLEQRKIVLENRRLPDLLLEAGEVLKAAEYLRDGNRLRVASEQALSLSSRLFEMGLTTEGRRIFELAEPLELLSGRPIPDDHTRPQNLWSLLRAWVHGAIIFRNAKEIVEIIRRICLAPSQFNREMNAEEENLSLQNWLFRQGAVSCAEHENWTTWQILSDALDKERDRKARFLTLLRSVQYSRRTDNEERTHQLLRELFTTFQPRDFATEITQNYGWQEACLSVAELALFYEHDSEIAHSWVIGLPAIPLQDTDLELDHNNKLSLHELRFRWARSHYLLGETRSPEALLRTAEACTRFSVHVEAAEKLAYRQVALAILQLAHLWSEGYQERVLVPSVFVSRIYWMLDLYERNRDEWQWSLRGRMAGARIEILRCMVSTATKHGSEAIKALRDELELRWRNSNSASIWGPDLRREIILVLLDNGIDPIWAHTQLQHLAPIMFHNLDPYGRVEACEAQAQAWLEFGESERAISELRRMVRTSRGIFSDKDYQLLHWIRWLGRVNEVEPQYIENRTSLMLRKMLSVQYSASGIHDAAEELLAVTFHWRPRQAVQLLKSFLEHDLTTHQGGMTRLLQTALEIGEPPVKEILYITGELIIPLVLKAEPTLLEKLIIKTSALCSRETALNAARYLVQRIRISAFVNHRPGWYGGVVLGLHSIGCVPEQVGLRLFEFEAEDKPNDSPLDKKLYLLNGQSLESEEVISQVKTVNDLSGLLKNQDEKRTQYFDWASLFESLAPQLSKTRELEELECLTGLCLKEEHLSRALVAISKRYLELGERTSAQQLAERAVKATRSSGWNPYYDGGVKYAALHQLIATDADSARRQIIKLYADDLSLGFYHELIPHFYDILTLLTENIPISEIWAIIECYLEELFAGVPVEPQPIFETLLAEPTDMTTPNTPRQAIADLLLLYLVHPSYVVAQGAVCACAMALIDGSEIIKTTLSKALSYTDQAKERALMVLDAVSAKSPMLVNPFGDTLEKLLQSPNFTVRLIATTIRTRVGNQVALPPLVARQPPAIYSLYLPESTSHHTEESVKGESAAFVMGDTARLLSPLDIEIRVVAKTAELPEDNVFYQANHHFQRLQKERTWLAEGDALAPKRLSQFLDQVKLRYSHNRPHIVPAKQALAYVVGELYDAGYLLPETLGWLPQVLIHYDPMLILEGSEPRPPYIEHIGGIPIDTGSYVTVPETWIETAQESLRLLPVQLPDGRIVIGERTRLRYLGEDWPEEMRMSVVRAIDIDAFWAGFDVENGHPPFTCHLSTILDYPYLEELLTNLIIANRGNEFETPGDSWLALNPSIGYSLGWSLRSDGWFRWANQVGETVAESIWWSDGPINSADTYLRVEVGNGWLVVVTPQGFDEIIRRTGPVNRGGVIWRSKGWFGDKGRYCAKSILGASL